MDELVNGRLDGVLNVAGEEFGGAEVGVSGDGSLVLVLLAMSGVGHYLVPYALGRRGGLDVEDHVGCLQPGTVLIHHLNRTRVQRIAVYF